MRHIIKITGKQGHIFGNLRAIIQIEVQGVLGLVAYLVGRWRHYLNFCEITDRRGTPDPSSSPSYMLYMLNVGDL